MPPEGIIHKAIALDLKTDPHDQYLTLVTGF